MSCPHDDAEMDTAAHADGMCPLCMAARIERLEAERNEWKATANRIVDKATARIERLEALLEWMDHKGGLGLDVHDRIRAALAGKSHT